MLQRVNAAVVLRCYVLITPMKIFPCAQREFPFLHLGPLVFTHTSCGCAVKLFENVSTIVDINTSRWLLVRILDTCRSVQFGPQVFSYKCIKNLERKTVPRNTFTTTKHYISVRL